jgi:hypothetical protein
MIEDEQTNQFSAPVDLLHNRVRLALMSQQMPVRVELAGFGETVREMVRIRLVESGYIVRYVSLEEWNSSSGARGFNVRDHWIVQASS